MKVEETVVKPHVCDKCEAVSLLDLKEDVKEIKSDIKTILKKYAWIDAIKFFHVLQWGAYGGLVLFILILHGLW